MRDIREMMSDEMTREKRAETEKLSEETFT
jgi:hypothetical protein